MHTGGGNGIGNADSKATGTLGIAGRHLHSVAGYYSGAREE